MVTPLEVVARSLAQQGAAFPKAGAELICKDLRDERFTIIETRLLLSWQLPVIKADPNGS